jgi:hypothetical protein
MKVDMKNYDVDEYYGRWYFCPSCDYSQVLPYSNYCSECAEKLEWEKVTVTHDKN